VMHGGVAFVTEGQILETDRVAGDGRHCGYANAQKTASHKRPQATEATTRRMPTLHISRLDEDVLAERGAACKRLIPRTRGGRPEAATLK